MDTTKNNKKILFVALACCLAICATALISSFANANESDDSEAKNEEVTKALVAGEDVSADDMQQVIDNAVEQQTSTPNELNGESGNINNEENQENGTTVKIKLNDKGKWGLDFFDDEITWNYVNSMQIVKNSISFSFDFYCYSNSAEEVAKLYPGGYSVGLDKYTGYNGSYYRSEDVTVQDTFSPHSVSGNLNMLNENRMGEYNKFDLNEQYNTVLFDVTSTTSDGDTATYAEDVTHTKFLFNDYTDSSDNMYEGNDDLQHLVDVGGELVVNPSKLAKGVYCSGKGADYSSGWYGFYTSSCTESKSIPNLSGSTGGFALDIFNDNDEVDGSATLSFIKEESSASVRVTNNNGSGDSAMFKCTFDDSSNICPILQLTTYNNKGEQETRTIDLTTQTQDITITNTGALLYFDYYITGESVTPSVLVKNEYTNEPIPNANVYIYKDAEHTTLLGYGTTGSDGKYTVSDSYVTSGDPLYYYVSADGYVDYIKTSVAKSTEEVIYMSNHVNILASLVDTDGNPAADQDVVIYNAETWDIIGSTTTDEDGKIKLYMLEPTDEVVFAAGDDKHYLYYKGPLKATLDLMDDDPITVYNVYNATIQPNDEWLGKVVDSDGNRVYSIPAYEGVSNYDIDGNKLTINYNIQGKTDPYSVTLTAVPRSDCEFVDWDIEPATDSTTIEGDLNVVANFKGQAQSATIKYVAAEGGSVNPRNEVAQPEATQATGSTATPNDGFVFVNWKDSDGNVVSKDPNFVPTKDESAEWESTTYVASFLATSAAGGSASATSTGSGAGTSTATGDANLYAIIALLSACAIAAGVIYYRKRLHK